MEKFKTGDMVRVRKRYGPLGAGNRFLRPDERLEVVDPSNNVGGVTIRDKSGKEYSSLLEEDIELWSD